MIYPDSLPIVIDEKLSRLRREGLLSQELHRAGIETNELEAVYGQFVKPFARRGAGAVSRRATRLSQSMVSFVRVI